MAKKTTSSRSHSSASSTTTTDHDEIRQWAESRGGKPSCVKGSGGGGDPGVLRIEFRDNEEQSLHEIPWDEFFEKFDEQQLALVYQDRTSGGQPSRFSKLISRDRAGASARGAARSAGGKKSAQRPGQATSTNTRRSKSAAGARASGASARKSPAKAAGESKGKRSVGRSARSTKRPNAKASLRSGR